MVLSSFSGRYARMRFLRISARLTLLQSIKRVLLKVRCQQGVSCFKNVARRVAVDRLNSGIRYFHYTLYMFDTTQIGSGGRLCQVEHIVKKGREDAGSREGRISRVR